MNSHQPVGRIHIIAKKYCRLMSGARLNIFFFSYKRIWFVFNFVVFFCRRFLNFKTLTSLWHLVISMYAPARPQTKIETV